MRTLHLFMKPPGTTVTLHTSPDVNVVTYGAVLERIPGGVVTKWLPAQLESIGGSEVLGPAQGHNVIVLPVIGKGGPATIETTISFSDGETREEPVTLTGNEAFGWRIFMT
jgi:hypothetical protein